MLTRQIDAPREKIFRAWTEPELMKQWFAPLPYTTPVVEIDVRSGGNSFIVMRGPDGTDMPMHGVYLEVVPNERIVFTDAFDLRLGALGQAVLHRHHHPRGQMAGAARRYTAVARHWNAEDREAHEEMGFHEGWGQCADQLAALVARI